MSLQISELAHINRMNTVVVIFSCVLLVVFYIEEIANSLRKTASISSFCLE